MLTNFRTVKKSIERFKEQLATTADETKTKDLSKKDRRGMTRAIEKYRKSLDGIREMTRLPDAVFVIDVNREHDRDQRGAAARHPDRRRRRLQLRSRTASTS